MMKQLCILYLLFLFILTENRAYAQEILNRDSLVSDFSYLIKQLEATHPDPYSGFGGKVFFHKEAFSLQNELKQNDLTAKGFTEKMSSFLSRLQDGHTFLFGSQESNENKAGYLPIGTRIIPNGIILSIVPAGYGKLLGSRIIGINNASTDSILQVIAKLNPCENIYDSYAQLKQGINQSDFLRKVCSEVKDSVCLQLETPDREKKKANFALVDHYALTHNPIETVPSWESFPSEGYMSYTFMDKQKQTMLFKLTSVMARENFESIIKNNNDEGYNQLAWFYQQYLNKKIPADTVQALAGVPSFSETFFQMLQEMKKHKSPVLIIDLRNNSGGWTSITLPSLYQLYGDRYLQTDKGTRFYRLLSPLFLEKNNITLDEFNQRAGQNYQLGEYTFYDEEEDNNNNDIEALRKQFIRNCMSSTKEELTKQKGQPVYSPQKVYVVTNEDTFSAAFHFAFYLWKMGATLVGVPTQQAPNTFMEMTPLQLPYSKINGSISNSMQIFLPANDKRTKILWPEIMLTDKDYKDYQFDRHAEIRYLMDIIEKNNR